MYIMYSVKFMFPVLLLLNSLNQSKIYDFRENIVGGLIEREEHKEYVTNKTTERLTITGSGPPRSISSSSTKGIDASRICTWFFVRTPASRKSTRSNMDR